MWSRGKGLATLANEVGRVVFTTGVCGWCGYLHYVNNCVTLHIMNVISIAQRYAVDSCMHVRSMTSFHITTVA